MKKYISIANCITSLRLIGAIILIFTKTFSMPFYIIYTICGVSDVLDGTIARMTGSASDFGSKLDSVSDLTFYTIMMLKVLPRLIEILPLSVWIIVGIILGLRVASYVTAAVKYKKFASLHTYLNKLTGAAVFSVPYLFMLQPYTIVLCIAVAIIGAISTAEELLMHLMSTDYDSSAHTIFQIKK